MEQPARLSTEEGCVEWMDYRVAIHPAARTSFVEFRGNAETLQTLLGKIEQALPVAIGSLAKLYPEKDASTGKLTQIKVVANYTPNAEFREHVLVPLVEQEILPAGILGLFDEF
jgi:hypothetical protein